jgi:hypothetical protein
MKYCDLSLTWFMCDWGEFKGRRRKEGEGRKERKDWGIV